MSDAFEAGQRSTQDILMVFWKGAKKAIPDSLPSKKKEQTERQFVEVPQTLPMARGNAREKT